MDSYNVETIDGGITAPAGFMAGAAASGIKKADKLDVAVVASECPAAVAGVFTQNKVFAAPVTQCRRVVASGTARAIVVNSGNANACTGSRGDADCAAMAQSAGAALGLGNEDVLVCSTGTIGIPMPMDKVRSGIADAVAGLSPDGAQDAALAIMTTDLVDKQIAVELQVDGKSVRIGAMAKGSGMIEPNMATMLGFLSTDAAVDGDALQACLTDAVNESFNRISVDGDQSTNDTVLLLANGKAGNEPLSPAHPDWDAFCEAVRVVTFDLAMKIVMDGEGATKFVTVTVDGAATDEDALLAAKAVANSSLCKTAWFGGDPNWGRIITAVGYSGAQVSPSAVSIRFDDMEAVRDGVLPPDASLTDLEAVYAREAFSIHIDLKQGEGGATVYTCDFSYDYVKINSEYMT